MFCFITVRLPLGVWQHSSVVSAIVRPINDTLQTIPLFVILIPFVMLFKIGDFGTFGNYNLCHCTFDYVMPNMALEICQVKSLKLQI